MKFVVSSLKINVKLHTGENYFLGGLADPGGK